MVSFLYEKDKIDIRDINLLRLIICVIDYFSFYFSIFLFYFYVFKFEYFRCGSVLGPVSS